VPGKNGKDKNRPPRLILDEHHQARIVPAALFSQLPDCVFGVRKCCPNIRQLPTNGIILDPASLQVSHLVGIKR
jgi:hypothetical protein